MKFYHFLPICSLTTALAQPWGSDDCHGSVYFLDNDPNGSSVVDITIGPDGRLKDDVTRTSTKGVGAIGTNLTGFPNPVDSLMSQGAIVVDQDVSFPLHARIEWC
jgi:hypothetical protein